MAGVIWVGGMKKAGALLFLIMWIPGLVSLAYRQIAKIGFADIGWKIGPWKYWALAFFVPLAVAARSRSRTDQPRFRTRGRLQRHQIGNDRGLHPRITTTI